MRKVIAIGENGTELVSDLNANFIEVYGRTSLFCVNVMDYGALGNGIADDTTSIQAAINATALGGTCFFPVGTYIINPATGIIVTQAIKLELEGRAELKTLVHALGGTQILYINSASDVNITGGKFTGEYGLHIGVAGGNHLIRINDSSNIHINDVYFSKAGGDCIACYRTLGDSSNILIENCEFFDTERWGIWLDITENVTVINCNFHDFDSDLFIAGAINVEYHGLLIDEAVMTGIKIVNNIFTNIGTPTGSNDGALTVFGKTGYLVNVIVRDNVSVDCSRFVNQGRTINSLITGNYVKNNGIGINIHSETNEYETIIIENNYFDTLGGILLNDTSVGEYGLKKLFGILIKNNMFANYTAVYPIQTTMGNCNGISIIDNIFRNCTKTFDIWRVYARDLILRNNLSFDSDGVITQLDNNLTINKLANLTVSRGLTTGEPTTGSYEIGEWLNDTNFIALGYMGHVCITAGTMDVINTTCTADNSDVILLLPDTPYHLNITLRDYIAVDGGATVRVLAISGNNITVSAPIAAGSPLAVVNVPATFKMWGALEP